MKSPHVAALVALSLLTFACGEVVPQNQVGAAPPAADPNAQDADAGVDGSAPLVPKRLVENRNPFGNLDPSNLVLDGDFEFTGRQGQMPWLSFNGDQATLAFETGGLCASGIRCAKLVRGSVLFGWMVSPKAGSQIQVSLKARILSGEPQSENGDAACPEPKLNVYVIDSDDQDVVARVRFSRNEPAINGYCTYRSVLGAIPFGSPGLYVEADGLKSNDAILIDDAVATLVPASPGSRALPPAEPVRAESKARVRALIDWIQRHRLFAPARPAQPLK